MLMPKQQFEYWVTIQIENQTLVAGTQRLPVNSRDYTTVFIPYTDNFCTVHDADITFIIRNIKPTV